MWLGRSIVLCLLLSLVCAGNNSFPAGFQFGAGTSSFQIEGGWNASDKSESIWDRYTHEFPAVIRDGSNGDVACDSYHLWQRDIDIAAELGLDFYRFSVSWPRVLPTGFSNYISEDGKNYYNNLIDGLLAKGIEPMVTMYHWDLPQRLQDLGGWSSPLIVDWFAEYARVLYSLYADRVKIWNTINEPLMVCDMSYANYSFAPNIVDIEVGRYLCNKHLVMAHARAWRIYDEEFRPKYNGMVSIVNLMLWFEPYAPGDEDLAELALQHFFGRYAHPIYSKEGGWPPSVEKIIAEKSKEEGYPSSRLPAFTKEEIELVRGTYDYMGINQYTARVVRRLRPGDIIGNFIFPGDVDMDIKFERRAEWQPTGAKWFKEYPESLRRMLSWVKSQYGDMKVIITENGYASSTSDHEDYNRINFFKNYLEQLLLAIHEDGVNVVGYSAWSLMDNFEWGNGYTTKFGLYEVDFKDPGRPRTARLSAKYYASIFKARSLDVPYNYTVESPVFIASLEAAYLKFPPNFKFGAATSAYQIEGAWNASDKSPSIWDDFAHTYPHLIVDGSNGDVVCDSYHQWERDIEVAHELGLHFYRFSISWTRLLPKGLSNEVSAVGKKYYSELIDGLLAKGIEPVVTLYHWDLPLRLQNLGGWANPLIANWFASYARVAYSLYADRVKTWITINEPLIVCDAGYSGALPPLVIDPAVGVYLCTKHILLAHAKAWRIYDKEFRPKYHGQVSLSNNVPWFETDSRGDAPLAELAMEYSAGRFSHPIFSKEGGWPPVLESFIAENSKKEGYTRSRLPAFTREEIELIRGTYDFYGLNHYTSRVVRRPKLDEQLGMWPFKGSQELGIILDTKPDWKPTHAWWFKQYPKGFRLLLSWLKEHYGDIPFLVTENGYAGPPGLDDEDRVDYYRDYLTQLMFAIKKDGVNVTGYTAWSLMDNLEWRGGYTSRFGLYEVNFTDPMRPRTARTSARYYSSIIKNHSLGEPDDNNSYIVWITIGVILVTIALSAILYKYYSTAKTHRERTQYESVSLSASSHLNKTGKPAVNSS